MKIRATVCTLLSALLLATVVSACGGAGAGGGNGRSFGTLPPAAPSDTTAVNAAPTPAALPDQSPLASFGLPKFDVSGNIVVKGIDPTTNVMQSPDNKDDVAYYSFSGHPGFGCPSAGKCANAVLSGHVDWYTGQVGVFWHLKDLNQGDEIDLTLQDGTVLKYQVVANTIYKSDEAPVSDILGNTEQESVTLITCDGVFNKALQEYNSRRIVRAVREA
jgi:LPXTG-site transpeptidase (sortase) family protein